MSQFSDILLTYIFPTIGCVLAFLAFGSSLVAVLRVRRVRRLGELNPIPYIGILGQTSGQAIYGSIIKNWFIFFANAPGLVIGLWLTLSTIVHATPKMQNIMTACIMALALYYLAIATITVHLDVTPDTRNTIWGFAGAFALLCYYVAPLTTLVKIIKARDSSTLNPLYCIMMFCNMALWLCYGLAIKNPFIWVPEMLGGTLSTTALVLLMVFPRNESSQLREEEGQLEALQAALPASTGLPLGVTPATTGSALGVAPASTGEDFRGGGRDPADTGVPLRGDSGPALAPYPEASMPSTTPTTGTGVPFGVDSGPAPAPYLEASMPHTPPVSASQEATNWSAGITADTSRHRNIPASSNLQALQQPIDMHDRMTSPANAPQQQIGV